MSNKDGNTSDLYIGYS